MIWQSSCGVRSCHANLSSDCRFHIKTVRMVSFRVGMNQMLDESMLESTMQYRITHVQATFRYPSSGLTIKNNLEMRSSLRTTPTVSEVLSSELYPYRTSLFWLSTPWSRLSNRVTSYVKILLSRLTSWWLAVKLSLRFYNDVQKWRARRCYSRRNVRSLVVILPWRHVIVMARREGLDARSSSKGL